MKITTTFIDSICGTNSTEKDPQQISKADLLKVNNTVNANIMHPIGARVSTETSASVTLIDDQAMTESAKKIKKTAKKIQSGIIDDDTQIIINNTSKVAKQLQTKKEFINSRTTNTNEKDIIRDGFIACVACLNGIIKKSMNPTAIRIRNELCFFYGVHYSHTMYDIKLAKLNSVLALRNIKKNKSRKKTILNQVLKDCNLSECKSDNKNIINDKIKNLIQLLTVRDITISTSHCVDGADLLQSVYTSIINNNYENYFKVACTATNGFIYSAKKQKTNNILYIEQKQYNNCITANMTVEQIAEKDNARYLNAQKTLLAMVQDRNKGANTKISAKKIDIIENIKNHLSTQRQKEILFDMPYMSDRQLANKYNCSVSTAQYNRKKIVEIARELYPNFK